MAKRRQTIAVDFDGVIHSYVSGWQGATVIPDPPVDGALRWLAGLLRDFDVAIVSSRARTWRGRRAIRSWLYREGGAGLWYEDGGYGGLEDIRVTATKVPAIVYIDDRAMRFSGPPFPSAQDLQELRPWTQPDRRQEGGGRG